MAFKSYRSDPRWIRAKYPAVCASCKGDIHRGENAYYYPSSRSLYCAKDDCGGQLHRDFEATAFDEAVYQQGAGV